jgi:hypothetical protein
MLIDKQQMHAQMRKKWMEIGKKGWRCPLEEKEARTGPPNSHNSHYWARWVSWWMSWAVQRSSSEQTIDETGGGAAELDWWGIGCDWFNRCGGIGRWWMMDLEAGTWWLDRPWPWFGRPIVYILTYGPIGLNQERSKNCMFLHYFPLQVLYSCTIVRVGFPISHSFP